MGKPKRKTGAGAIPIRDKPLKSPVTLLDNNLIDSPALLAMVSTSKSGYPLLVYLHFLQKRIRAKSKQKPGHERIAFINADELTFSYDEARRLGIGARAFRQAIDKLLAYGFIDIMKSGNGLQKGDCSIYALSERWRKWGTTDFEQASRIQVRHGFCASRKADCRKCIHTGGGHFNECLLPGQSITDGKCSRYERWLGK